MQSFDEREKIVNYGLIHIIDNNRPIRKIFNKANYSKEFHALYDLYTQALTAYNYLYKATKDWNKVLNINIDYCIFPYMYVLSGHDNCSGHYIFYIEYI